MPVDDLVRTAERAALAARKVAADLLALDEGHEARATLLVHVAQALEMHAREALAAPDETPPSGLDALIDELEHPAGLVARRLAEKLREGRSLVRELLEPTEITGEAGLVERAQAWLRDTGKLRRAED